MLRTKILKGAAIAGMASLSSISRECSTHLELAGGERAE
jgi:hypothetical protein